jgi:uncharacterized membrane protein
VCILFAAFARLLVARDRVTTHMYLQTVGKRMT